jgi:hypothetical protein
MPLARAHAAGGGPGRDSARHWATGPEAPGQRSSVRTGGPGPYSKTRKIELQGVQVVSHMPVSARDSADSDATEPQPG